MFPNYDFATTSSSGVMQTSLLDEIKATEIDRKSRVPTGSKLQHVLASSMLKRRQLAESATTEPTVRKSWKKYAQGVPGLRSIAGRRLELQRKGEWKEIESSGRSRQQSYTALLSAIRDILQSPGHNEYIRSGPTLRHRRQVVNAQRPSQSYIRPFHPSTL